MDTFDNNSVVLKPVKRNRLWMRILFIGFLIYVSIIIALMTTGNPNLFPTLVLVGNFLVPVSFVSFFYERRNSFSINLSSTALSFIYGGILGTIAAAILEPYFINALTFRSSFTVGIIEESTKMVGVLLIARHIRYKSMIDGIVLGAAAGMGFAAFESTGYAFTNFLNSGGSITEVLFITLLRGLTSPVGHGTWTAILASILFRESGPQGYRINYRVIGAYLTVVILHGLWDGLPFVINLIIPIVHAVLIGQLAVGAAGIIILYLLLHQARNILKS